MKPFEVVSLDMFQTLVNVDSRIEQIWKPILVNTYTYEAADECGRLLLSYFFEHWQQMKETKLFFLMREVYERSFGSLFRQMNLSYESAAALEILFEEHTRSEFYEDTVGFLKRILQKYKVCIVSDADEAMIPEFYKEYGMRILTSERYRSYKNDENNTMFKELLQIYHTNPDKVIHIGDSVSDVVGAKREGIKACWLNRHKRTWKHEVEPDFVIETLSDLESIL
ncbi:HAD family hydrolase [Paenibacillus macerans]|uniref:HAD family hydrolase n=1 Tax=Paenibacillus macerans TaxID=44252 RepID=UPI00203F9B42|nr:HAD family hydrolase [Paenibacillus macerans]MCM3698818.1 HAD family hydrolase [Paenibacillus macerans]